MKLFWNNFRQNYFSRSIDESRNNFEIISFYM